MPAMTMLQLNCDSAGIAPACSPLFAGMACSYKPYTLLKPTCTSGPCPR